MRNSMIDITVIAFLFLLAHSTIIITEYTPQVYEINDGQTMIVFGEDLQEDEPTSTYQEPQKQIQSSSITQIPVVAQELPQQNSETSQRPENQKVATRIQTTTTTHYRSYYERKEVHYVKMFSSFGGLGHRTDEESYRKIVHESNIKWMQEHSQREKLTFTMKENQFSMLTIEEFKQYYLNLVVPDFVPDFKMDFHTEIKKFFRQDKNFLKKFFDLDFSTDLSDSDFFSFDQSSKNKPSRRSFQDKKNNKKSDKTPEYDVLPEPDIVPEETTKPEEQEITPTYDNTTPEVIPSDKNLLPDTPDESTQDETVTPEDTSTDIPEESTPTSEDFSSTETDNSQSVVPKTDILPSSVVLDIDWTKKGYVTSIKDQGSCGGCYAFTAQATLQSAFLMKDSTLYKELDLSEQQIIDCSKPQGNNGCNGGWMPLVYDYIIKYGITTEAAYPYLEKESSCKMSGGSFKISSYKGGALSNCSALSVMVTGRPVGVAVSAGNQYWQNYAGGIMNQCGTGEVDHGVTLVGVYQDDSENYWRIKNSWGTEWGEDGYIRLDRSIGNGNICSICSYGFYPQI